MYASVLNLWILLHNQHALPQIQKRYKINVLSQIGQAPSKPHPTCLLSESGESLVKQINVEICCGRWESCEIPFLWDPSGRHSDSYDLILIREDRTNINLSILHGHAIYIDNIAMSDRQENLQRFKIVYSREFMQIIPQSTTYSSQLLINLANGAAHFEPLQNQYQFPSNSQVKLAALILGTLNIEGGKFLIYADNVYLQAALPPTRAGIYQVASIDYIPYEIIITARQKQILKTLKHEIFNFSFYFSFQKDLTLSMQRLYGEEKKKPRESFFWNYGMLRAMIGEADMKEWLVPVIQGHYSTFQVTIGNRQISYYLLSRRSKYRSGTRFYNRGIDENSNCAQFIETEQIITFDSRVFSLVMLSGSVPLFWQQKSQSGKVRLTRNKELATLPFIEHIHKIHQEYQRVLLINLLQKRKDNENLLLQAYQQLVSQNMNQLGAYTRYAYFDMNEALKMNNRQQIYAFLKKLDPLLKQFGFFSYDSRTKQKLSRQTGVFRISCLDCLSRTSRFMQLLCFYIMHEQLSQEGVIAESASRSTLKELMFGDDLYVSTLVLAFRTLWEEKADFQSLIYAGSRATSGKRHKFLDDLQDSFISLQRLYNQKYLDQIKQKALDVLLYHKHYRINSILRNRQNSEFHIGMMTWNVNATHPEAMKGLEFAIGMLTESDMVVVGLQQMIELSTNNVVTSNEEDSQESTAWERSVQKFLNGGQYKYIFVQKIEMVGLLLMVFIADRWKHAIKGVQRDSVKTGMGGQFGNKGSVALRMRIFETSLCFACCHLAAGYSKVAERLQDIETIHQKAFQQSKIGVQNEALIEDSDYRWMFGDLNFRVNGDFKEVKGMLEESKDDDIRRQEVVNMLFERDQLSICKKDPMSTSMLTGYQQHQINFMPTYKLDRQTGCYTEEKGRNPSWCDRILYSDPTDTDHTCECIKYTDVGIAGSDHRPVVARFRVIIRQMIGRSKKSGLL